MATINYKHRSRDFEVEVHRSHLIIFVVVGMCFVDRKGLKCSLLLARERSTHLMRVEFHKS